MKTKKFFVAADSHVLLRNGKIGGVDLKTNNAVVKFLEDESPWDGYIHLGDLFDFNVISAHNKGNLRAVAGEDVAGQFRAGNAYIKQHTEAAWNRKEDWRFYLIEGNHEQRMERYLNANPELVGTLDVAKNIPEWVDWIPFWSKHEILEIGKAKFIHGIDTGVRQVGTALKDYGSNVFMGHTHRRQLESLRYHGHDSTKVAESLPCLCEYAQTYLRNKPTAWQQGFAVFYFLPDGNFHYTVTSIFDHKFISPTGKWYDGNRMKPETKLVLT